MKSETNRIIEADLHCHSTASDGELDPKELIKKAAEIGLRAVGITDHDTISGWDEAYEAGAEYSIEVVRGIELNTDWDGIEVHILGYELDRNSDFLHEKLNTLKEARFQRMMTIVERLNQININITVDDIVKYTKGESIGRPHIAQALIRKGFASSNRDAFDRYIGLGAPAYVPRFKLTPIDGIKLIREANGVAVLAHPGVHRLKKGIPEWVGAGLQGIEVSHSEHDVEDENRCREVAESFNLLMTGGSDFHGESRKPGVHMGSWGVPMDVVWQIQSLTQKN